LKVISAKFLRFAIAGVAGFAVDAVLVYALRGQFGPYVARLVSFPAAVVVTWLINRTFAFATHQKHLPLWREFLHYFAAMLGGGAINYVAYGLLLAFVEPVSQHPIIAIAFGSLAGLAVNFFLAHSFVFGKMPSERLP
jgi:putative flippase GtrA